MIIEIKQRIKELNSQIKSCIKNGDCAAKLIAERNQLKHAKSVYYTKETTHNFYQFAI